MIKIVLAGLVVGPLTAMTLALAAPAQADYGHHQWIADMSHSASGR